MKKTTLYIVGIILLVMAIVAVILAKNGTFRPVSERGPEADCFAVKDTAAIQKIFIADQRGNMVLLSKKEGAWFVNDSMPALTENVNDLLSIIRNITVVHTVQKKGQPTINEAIARRGIKVEIYQIAPKFSLFGIDFSVKERKTQVYYIGEATQTNLGNYALLEGAKEPCIVCVPGFRGYLSPLYSPIPTNWYSHTLYQTKITRIASVDFVDYENPEESFRVEKVGARFFNVYNSKNEIIADYDTTKLINMLSEFRERNYVAIAPEFSSGERDTIAQAIFKTITLKDTEGKVSSYSFYRLMQLMQVLEDGNETGETEWVANKDVCYATEGNDFSTVYRIQYHYFQRQMQPLSYFLKSSEEE